MLKIRQINEKTPEQLKIIDRFAQKPLGFLLLSGANGLGKSFVAEAIYELHAPYKLPYYDKDVAYFVTQGDLNEQWLRAKIDGGTLDMLERLKGTKLLIIDDLGTKTPTEAFGEFLYLLFDSRWRNRDKLGTIITTNMTSDMVRERFSDAVLSRIASGEVIRFEGKDRRFNKF